MRFDQFQLFKVDYSLTPLENLITAGLNEMDSMERSNDELFIQNASYHLEGIGLGTIAKPLSSYALENFLYIQGFSYYEVGNYYTRRESLDSYQLKYTYEGEGELIYGGKSYSLKPNQGYVIDCRKPHEYHTVTGPWKHCEIHFSGAPASYIYEQFSAGNIVHFEVTENTFHPELEKLVSLHEKILPYRELQISHQLEHILLTILCNSDSYLKTAQNIPENLYYLLAYIDKHYMQPLTLDYLAEFSNISKYHLCRLFRKHLGYSPNEYLIQIRIETAKKLLQSTSVPANKIAAMVGIADENYFYRLFKSRVGISAKEFRNARSQEQI